MRLLVTRPQPDAEATAARLRALGHDVLVEPLLQTEVLPVGASVDPAAIVVTSRNGIRALSAWPASKAWHPLPLLAVGPATEAAAVATGFTNVTSAAGDGTALAELVKAEFAPSVGTILYPAAEERSPDLEAALLKSGYAVKTVVAYRMVPSDALSEEVLEAFRSGAIDGVLLYSRRTATTFVSHIDRAGLAGLLQHVRMFALSDNVASILAGREVGGIEVAPLPSEDALLSLVPATC